MPRKQRFKPSRKPKAVGTSPDLTTIDRSGPAIVPIELASSRDITSGNLEPGDRVHREAEELPSIIVDLGGEAG